MENANIPATDRAESDVFETVIDKLLTGGDGLGHLDKLAVFVPGVVPGERVRVRIVERGRGFARAELLEILDPSPHRVEPPLGEIGASTGCDLQHMDPAAQRAAKTDIVRDCLQRQGRLDPGERLRGPEELGEDVVGPALGYRNKIRLFRSDTGLYGMRRKGSHDALPIESSPLMPPVFDETILPYLRTLPPVDQVVVRLDTDGGSLLSLYGPPARQKVLRKMIDETPGDAPYAGCRGLLLNNRPLWGRDHLLPKVAGHTYRVHAGSFFQVNYKVAETIVKTLETWLDERGPTADAPGPLLADLYCGVGLFGVALADRFERVIGVENDANAVRDARNNIGRSKRPASGATIHEGLTEKLTKAWKFGEAPDGIAVDWREATVVADPPRAGLGRHVTNDLLELSPRRIFLLSCDPATLARDLRALTGGGYELERLQVFDMFPQTSHIETLAELRRA